MSIFCKSLTLKKSRSLPYQPWQLENDSGIRLRSKVDRGQGKTPPLGSLEVKKNIPQLDPGNGLVIGHAETVMVE